MTDKHAVQPWEQPREQAPIVWQPQPYSQPPLVPFKNASQTEYEIQRPARAPNIKSDVLVPLLWVTVFATGVGLTVLGLFLRVIYAQPLWLALTIAAGLGTYAWCYIILRVWPDLLYVVETWVGRDINQDGTVGKPGPLQPPERPILSNVQVEGPKERQDRLKREWVKAAFRTDGKGRYLNSGEQLKAVNGEFSRTFSRNMRDWAIRCGLARWRHAMTRTGGWTWTASLNDVLLAIPR